MFFDYFIRCEEADKPTLLSLAERLGVLTVDEAGQHQPTDPAWVWQPIGRLMREVDGEQVVSSTPEGEPYWHANLRMTRSLYELAQEVYAADPSPELAAGLADFSRFFFVDPETGDATRPAQPAVVFL